MTANILHLHDAKKQVSEEHEDLIGPTPHGSHPVLWDTECFHVIKKETQGKKSEKNPGLVFTMLVA